MPASASASSVSVESNPGWLRNQAFDFHFIITITVLAIVTGCVAILKPDLFRFFLYLDVWLLGYHHVVSTFTRLVFDKESFRQNRFLVLQLPIIVIACTIAAVYFIGSWTIATTYLYWQWFHYTRQSYGVERMYRRKVDEAKSVNDFLTTRVLYLLPIFGIMYRSWQNPGTFLGVDVFTFSVPTPLLVVTGIVTALVTAYWGAVQVRAYTEGKMSTAHTWYVVSHLAVFLFGYILIKDITAGWLVINIWHNAQYILFVWWFNNKRFEKGVDPKSQFLSTISQRENILIYMGVCLAISTVIYVALIGATSSVYQQSSISLTVVALMVLNFHHYIVDSVIWRRKKTKKIEPAQA